MVSNMKKSVLCRHEKGDKRPKERKETQGEWGRGGNPDPRGALSGQTRACEVPATSVFTVG